MDINETKGIVEALLFVSDKPITLENFKEVLGEGSPDEIKRAIDVLNNEYLSTERSFSIKEIAGGFQIMTNPIYSKWISDFYKKAPDRLTGPALETLAIIAYKQPLTRSEIEAIRGVNVDGVLSTLEDRSLIRTRGRKDSPGRPILYGTTNEFLRYFGLKSLEELPNLKEFQETDLDFVKDKEKAEAIDTESGKLVSEEAKDEIKEAAQNN